MLLESTSVEEKMKQMQEEIIRYHRIIDQLNYTIELQKEKLEAYKNQTSNSK
jgi:3-keto-L-gulonate-6-phosphate decarboxylase